MPDILLHGYFGTDIASVADSPLTYLLTRQMDNLPTFGAWQVLISDPVYSISKLSSLSKSLKSSVIS